MSTTTHDRFDQVRFKPGGIELECQLHSDSPIICHLFATPKKYIKLDIIYKNGYKNGRVTGRFLVIASSVFSYFERA